MKKCILCGQPVPGSAQSRTDGPPAHRDCRSLVNLIKTCLETEGRPGATGATGGEKFAQVVAEARLRLTHRPAPSTILCTCCGGAGGHTGFYGPNDNYDSWNCFCDAGNINTRKTDPCRRCAPFAG